MNDWVDVDIGDQVTMPAGIMVEKRTYKGKTQFRNPTILPVCSPYYIDLVQGRLVFPQVITRLKQ